MWRVPSDLYKIKNPSLTIKDNEIKFAKSRRQAITAEGATFRFIRNKAKFKFVTKMFNLKCFLYIKAVRIFRIKS